MVGSNEGHTVHVTCTIQYLLVPRLGTRVYRYASTEAQSRYTCTTRVPVACDWYT